MCPYCGTKIGHCQRTCPKCGKLLVPPPNYQFEYCQECGRTLPVDCTICPKCKWNVAEFYKKRKEEMEATAPTSKFCSNCGKQLNPNHKFCASCGAPVIDRPQYQNFQTYPQTGTSRPKGSSLTGWNIFWIVIASCLVFTLTFCGGCFSCFSSPEDDDGITLEEYEQIEQGMSYEEVCDIIGCEGVVSGESEYMGEYLDMNIEMYGWRDESGGVGYCTVTFSNGEVIEKTQINLD